MEWFRVLSLVSLLTAVASTNGKHILQIGGIFHDDDNESMIAMQYAVKWINLYNNGQNSDLQFTTNMQIVSKADSFKTGKIVCNMTESGVAAIIGPDSLSSTGIVQSVCATLEIPHIQTNWNPTTKSFLSKTVLNLYPEPNTLARALADVLKEMKWKSYTIVYEDDDSLVRLQNVLKATTPEVPITVRQLGEGTDYRPLLKDILVSQESNVILDCETSKITEILEQALDVDLLKDYQSFLLTSLDAHTLDFGKLMDRLPNITTIRIVDPSTTAMNNAIRNWETIDYNNNRRKQILSNPVLTKTALVYDAIHLFAATIKDLHSTEPIHVDRLSCTDNNKTWNYGIGISHYMKLKPMAHGLTGPLKLDHMGRRSDFQLQVVELVKDGFRATSTWTPRGLNFTRTDTELYSQIVENLQKKVFIVSSRLGPPYLMKREPKDGEVLEGNQRYEGYSMDLIDGISKILNFAYRFELAPDNAYGSYNHKTKSWNGLIKQLLERKADLAICDLTITYERRKAVDFTMPFMTLGISILYSKSAKEPPDLFSFTSPLSTDVWMFMATAFLGVSLLLYILARMSPGDWENPHPCNQDPDELENIWDLKNCLWLTLGSIMAQGCDILPKGIATRMVSGMWWFFALILLSSYTANLAAFLTMERMGPTIESAEDLAKQSKIKYGGVLGGSTLQFFKESNFSTYQKMWAAMESARPSVFTGSNQEGVERVLKHKKGYAFLMESTSIEYEVQRSCDLMQVGGLLDSKGYGIAMPVNSPYRTAISGAVLKMQEGGDLHRIKEKWWKTKNVRKEDCDDDSKHSAESANELDLANVGGVFVVLFGGVGIAFIVAVLEFLWNVRKVAVDEQLTLCEALVIELKFAMNIFITKKATRPKVTDSSSASTRNGSETRSIAQNVLKQAGSFLHLDMFNNDINKK